MTSDQQETLPRASQHSTVSRFIWGPKTDLFHDNHGFERFRRPFGCVGMQHTCEDGVGGNGRAGRLSLTLFGQLLNIQPLKEILDGRLDVLVSLYLDLIHQKEEKGSR